MLWSVGIVVDCYSCCGVLELLWSVRVVVECCCGV